MKRILISLILIALNFSLKAQIPISNLPNTVNPVGAYVPVARNGFNYKLLVDSIASGKLDSLKVSNDTLYSYKRGVKTFVGVIVGGSGGSTDSTIFATVYRTDTLAQNIRDEIAALPAPTTPTLQEVFATESNNALMTGNFKVNVNGHDIDFDDAVNGFITVSSYFSMVGGDSLNMQSSAANRILLKNDTVFIKPVLGNLNIDSLNSGSSADSVLVWNKETGSVKYRNAADFGGIGGVGITRIAPTDSTTGDSYGAQIIGGNSLQLNTFSTENYGVVPPSTGTTTDFLRADGTWSAPAGSGSHVDTIYRKAGKDSIFFKINGGAERAIKDSTGGSSGLTIGSTAITSSRSGSILYDSSGILSNNALFTYNSSGELQVGSETDEGAYVLQATGDVVFRGGVSGTAYTYYKTASHLGHIRQDNSGQMFVNGSSTTLFGSGGTMVMQLYNGKAYFASGGGTGSARVEIGPGTTSIAPFALTAGTNKTTAQNGSFEYNGTNFFVTRTGNARENLLSASAVNTVSPTSPNRTIAVNINGTTYYIHAKTTND